jgi:hypothetical protein
LCSTIQKFSFLSEIRRNKTLGKYADVVVLIERTASGATKCVALVQNVPAPLRLIGLFPGPDSIGILLNKMLARYH